MFVVMQSAFLNNLQQSMSICNKIFKFQGHIMWNLRSHSTVVNSPWNISKERAGISHEIILEL